MKDLITIRKMIETTKRHYDKNERQNVKNESDGLKQGKVMIVTKSVLFHAVLIEMLARR